MYIEMGKTGNAFETGYSVLGKNGLAILGMSLDNSYFNEDSIRQIIDFASENFSRVRIMVPDEPMKYTYTAMGYRPDASARKARLKGNALKNMCLRSMSEETVKKSGSDIILLDWGTSISQNPAYTTGHGSIQHMYNDNKTFRKDARDTAKNVLTGKLKRGVEIEKAIDEGVNFVIDELGFITASPAMFDANEIAYIYHKDWHIYQNLVDGNYDGKIREGLGFLIVK